MKKIMICAAALLGLAIVSPAAQARVHHVRTMASANAATAKLNQQQLAQAQAATPQMDQGVAPDSSGMAATQPTPEDSQIVTVAAPAHDATETVRQPDTSPPSTGTPSIDTPYVARVPANYTTGQ